MNDIQFAHVNGLFESSLACAVPEKRQGGPNKVFFSSHQRISQRAVQTSFEKQLAQGVQLLLEGDPYQNFKETYSHL